MITKKQFFARLKKSRRTNADSNIGNFKLTYSEKDNELAWRLFQVFPSAWDEDKRYDGLCLLIPHMTLFVHMYLSRGIAPAKIVEPLHKHLISELHYHISPKYLRVFVKDVQRTKSLNNL